MTKEQLDRAEVLQSAITSWQNKKDAIELDATKIALTYINGSFRGSMDLNKEEIQLVREALVSYYDSKLAPLQEEFEKL